MEGQHREEGRGGGTCRLATTNKQSGKVEFKCSRAKRLRDRKPTNEIETRQRTAEKRRRGRRRRNRRRRRKAAKHVREGNLERTHIGNMLHESIATRLLLPPLIHHDLFPPLLLLLLLWLDTAQTRREECCFAGHVVFAVGMLPSPPSPCTVYMLLTQHKMLRSTQAKERKRKKERGRERCLP